MIEIPKRLQHRPRWNGLPVPFTTLLQNGVPDFRVTDIREWKRAAEHRLCGLCGEPHEYWIWFIGGEKCPRWSEGRMPYGYFADLGMHRDCADYAKATCPYLSGKHPEFSKRPVNFDQVKSLVFDSGVSAERPARMGMFQTRSYTVISVVPMRVKTGQIFGIEWFWEDGK